MMNTAPNKKLNVTTKNVDTIAAIATAAGIGGVGVIRVSGPLVCQIAEKILGTCPAPRLAHFAKFKYQNKIIDEGLALFFPNPNSFTGEDVLELQGHGGPVVLNMLLNAVISSGARLAEPGEFSRRAFLNGKMDLTQAEAVADLINAHSEQAAAGALRSLQGEFKNKINNVVSLLINVRKFVEAAIDFPEEEIDFLSDKNLAIQLEQLNNEINKLEKQAQQGAILRQGIHVVIAGSPNAGKSSLLNALSERDSAIVTEIAGTTRDVLREHINLNGVPLHLVDTAGLRETDDIIEKEGIKRAHHEMNKADLILLIVDASQKNAKNFAENQAELIREKNKNIPIVFAYNKIDLISEKEKIENNSVYFSVKESRGMDLLKQYLLDFIGWNKTSEDVFVARTRHVNSIKEARELIQKGIEQFKKTGAGEMLAEDLRLAQNALNGITGEFTSDDLLGKIFAEFCIGK